jgi:hypothetical protein
MGLDVYYPQDIRNALLAAEQASTTALMATSLEGDQFAQGYQEGYRAALTTIALAFGLIRSAGCHENPDWPPTFLAGASVCNRRNSQ